MDIFEFVFTKMPKFRIIEDADHLIEGKMSMGEFAYAVAEIKYNFVNGGISSSLKYIREEDFAKIAPYYKICGVEKRKVILFKLPEYNENVSYKKLKYEENPFVAKDMNLFVEKKIDAVTSNKTSSPLNDGNILGNSN